MSGQPDSVGPSTSASTTFSAQSGTGTRPYPYSNARSTGMTSPTLMASILASDALDEISSGDGVAGVERYIRGRGLVDAKTQKTMRGMMFWYYPTGLYGPYHEMDDGSVERHGTLVTIERGVDVREAAQQVHGALITKGIGHVHVQGDGWRRIGSDELEEE